MERQPKVEALRLDTLESFFERADSTSDIKLHSNLLLSTSIAEVCANRGGLALVVGGFVRDALYGKIYDTTVLSKDIDIEVYGVELDRLGEILGQFGQVNVVGASFGVLKVTNPQTGDTLDFSIPREDSKVDRGHKGFVVSGNPHMSVREAARRRDITINALAMNPLTGEIIDEYDGVSDLRRGILRATDLELFGDDPLRSLRLMQFAGRYGFEVDEPTAELCRSFDLTELPRERIGEEWRKLLLKSSYVAHGLETARSLGILQQLHPELAVLDTIEQEPEWHPEGNVWEHTKLAVEAASYIVQTEGLTGDNALVVLLAVLLHDLGKAHTTVAKEKHGTMRLTAHGHDLAGVEPARQFMHQIDCTNNVTARVLPLIREHLFHVSGSAISNKAIYKFAQRLKPASIYEWNLVSKSDANGRGLPFVDKTLSHDIYDRSLGLQVDTKPAQPIVNGRDLITHLGLTQGVQIGVILRELYEAQLDGEFTTIEGGIAYYKSVRAQSD